MRSLMLSIISYSLKDVTSTYVTEEHLRSFFSLFFLIFT
jgi:hypothetical protein